MNALSRQYFRRRKHRRNRRNYNFFGSNLSQNIMVSICVTLLQFFYPRANDTFGTPFGGWFGSTWSISAGRGSLKSCYGVKLCLMLAENAVLCQRDYDGFLRYFFYLTITIKVLLIFSLELLKPRNARIGAVKCRYMKVFQRTRNERNLFFTPCRPDR